MRRDLEQITTAPDGQPMQAQPAWRKDFPIDTPQDNYVARRRFHQVHGSHQPGVCGRASVDRGAERDPPVSRQVGPAARGAKGRRAHRRDGDFHLSRRSRSVACCCARAQTISWPTARSARISRAPWCRITRGAACTAPCHNGAFEIASGRPIQGPPRRPLPKVVLEINGEEIYAAGVEERTV